MGVRRAGIARDRCLLLAPSAGGACSEFYGFRYLRPRRSPQSALCRVCELRRATANPAVLEGLGQYALLCRRRRPAIDRGVAGRSSSTELKARKAQAVL